MALPSGAAPYAATSVASGRRPGLEVRSAAHREGRGSPPSTTAKETFRAGLLPRAPDASEEDVRRTGCLRTVRRRAAEGRTSRPGPMLGDRHGHRARHTELR